MLRRSFTTEGARWRALGRAAAQTAICLILSAASAEVLAQTAPKRSEPRPEVESSIAPAEDAPVSDQAASQPTPDAQADRQAATGYAPQSGGTPMPPSGALTDKLDVNIGGGLILFYYQPLQSGRKNYFEIFEARLRMDAKYGRYSMHITPRFRNTKERDFFPGISWVEEAYMAAEFGPTILKVGKIYRQFGRFWDNSFMGNVQEYDGLKLDMNHGLSFEGLLNEKERFGAGFSAQYFLVDGTTNYALPGRDTPALLNQAGNPVGARRRNQLVGRVEPFMKVTDKVTVKLGLSEEYFQADGLPNRDTQHVTRTAVDTTVIAYGVTAWAEFTRQWGRHTTEFPFATIPETEDDDEIPGRSSNRVNYWLVGGEYTYDMFTLRYNFSVGDYVQVDLKETRHVPGVAVTVNEYMMALLEWSHVQHHSGGRNTLLDSALCLTLHGKF